MMRPTFALVVAMIALAAARLEAQDPRLIARLDRETLAQVSVIIDSARAAGLPMEPLVDRALEGAKKGGTPAGIAKALRTRAFELGSARRALFPATDAEIIAGADAVSWKVPETTLTNLRRVRAGADLTVPLGVLADLVGKGVQLDTASAVVIALARSNVRDNDMLRYRQVVESDIRLGSLPAAAAMTRAEGLATSGFDMNPASGNAPGTVRGTTPTKP
jgi:hypothetical protein